MSIDSLAESFNLPRKEVQEVVVKRYLYHKRHDSSSYMSRIRAGVDAVAYFERRDKGFWSYYTGIIIGGSDKK